MIQIQRFVIDLYHPYFLLVILFGVGSVSLWQNLSDQIYQQGLFQFHKSFCLDFTAAGLWTKSVLVKIISKNDIFPFFFQGNAVYGRLTQAFCSWRTFRHVANPTASSLMTAAGKETAFDGNFLIWKYSDTPRGIMLNCVRETKKCKNNQESLKQVAWQWKTDDLTQCLKWTKSGKTHKTFVTRIKRKKEIHKAL